MIKIDYAVCCESALIHVTNNGLWIVTFRLEGEPVSALSGSVCECCCSGALCGAERLLPAAADLRVTAGVCAQCCAALLLQL